MNFRERKTELNSIYEDYEREVALFKAGAICKPGCSFCCTHFGNVDITTLEGRIIREWVTQQRPDERADLQRRIEKNQKARRKGASAPCPFLKSDLTCLIYALRPFSCRQLYSVRPCDGRGPTIHRQAREAARRVIARLQQLDTTGYSGHISYILGLLDQKKFRKVYLKGGFDPVAIQAFGKKHAIVINRLARRV
jgi:hypothetical protein